MNCLIAVPNREELAWSRLYSRHHHDEAVRFAIVSPVSLLPPAGLILLAYVAAATAAAPVDTAATIQCLPDGTGFFRARLSGAMDVELDWPDAGTECTGGPRPDGGLRVAFSRPIYADGERLVLVFGIPGLREGRSARAMPVNLTVIRQGSAQFFSTQGDDKCTLDEVHHEPFLSIPRRQRLYKVVVRGFCTEPARALDGKTAVLMTRFDFAGRIDYEEPPPGSPL